MEPTILIVEDDDKFRELLAEQLEEEGYQVLHARDGVEGVQMVQQHQPDLMLLDVMMPRMDGWEVCHQVRQFSDMPIVILSGRLGEKDKVRGLELGADDYITKPFSPLEFMARVRAALRRGSQSMASHGIVRVDQRLVIDRGRCEVWVEGRLVNLSPTEYKVLDCLLDHCGRLLTHQSLLTQVWGWEYIDEVDYLRVHIHNLRKKIEVNPRSPIHRHRMGVGLPLPATQKTVTTFQRDNVSTEAANA
jgi:DNA-binding response OmpR family regulator